MTTLVAVVLVIGPDRIDQSPWYAAVVVLPIVTLIAAQLLAFRCPHCGARAVRGQYGYWVVADTCGKCLREFEGPPLSDDELAEKFVAKDNPELARRMRQERLEVEDLRKRAPTDPQAAVTLEKILKKRLEGVEFWVQDMRRLYALRQANKGDVGVAEACLKELHDDIVWCASLSHGAAERSRLTSA